MACKNKVSQFVPKGYAHREVILPCGSTSIHGTVLLCEDCQRLYDRMYPQGWRHRPGDTCVHGYSGEGLCYRCESED